MASRWEEGVCVDQDRPDPTRRTDSPPTGTWPWDRSAVSTSESLRSSALRRSQQDPAQTQSSTGRSYSLEPVPCGERPSLPRPSKRVPGGGSSGGYGTPTRDSNNQPLRSGTTSLFVRVTGSGTGHMQVPTTFLPLPKEMKTEVRNLSIILDDTGPGLTRVTTI